jgi:hypothetical protein
MWHCCGFAGAGVLVSVLGQRFLPDQALWGSCTTEGLPVFVAIDWWLTLSFCPATLGNPRCLRGVNA